MLNDLDAEALPYLARVTAFYLNGKKVIDRRGKRVCSLLGACDQPALRSVRKVILFCRDSLSWETKPAIELRIEGKPDFGETLLHLVAGFPVEEGVPLEVARIDADDSFFEAFHLLKQWQFAREPMTGFWGSASGPSIAIVDREAIDFLAPFVV